jgi:hypothetical protein
MTTPSYSSYFLIDSALLDGSDVAPPTAAKQRPAWLTPVYDDNAATVSPLVIDILAAWEAGQLNILMKLVHACRPQLHVSILETAGTVHELVQHLRQFIYINTDEGRQLSLRFADCAVLPALAGCLNGAQWSALTKPLLSWRVHRRDGTLMTLPPAREAVLSATPLTLSSMQIDGLLAALGNDHVLRNVLLRRHMRALPGSALEQFRRTGAARLAWHAAGHTDDDPQLLFFADAVLETAGRLLVAQGLQPVLEQTDANQIRDGLRRLMAEFH